MMPAFVVPAVVTTAATSDRSDSASVASRTDSAVRRWSGVLTSSASISGESLGGVESLIEHPGKMTHLSVAGTQLEVPSDLIRLSVGIEDAEDLIADLDRALA